MQRNTIYRCCEHMMARLWYEPTYLSSTSGPLTIFGSRALRIFPIQGERKQEHETENEEQAKSSV